MVEHWEGCHEGVPVLGGQLDDRLLEFLICGRVGCLDILSALVRDAQDGAPPVGRVDAAGDKTRVEQWRDAQ